MDAAANTFAPASSKIEPISTCQVKISACHGGGKPRHCFRISLSPSASGDDWPASRAGIIAQSADVAQARLRTEKRRASDLLVFSFARARRSCRSIVTAGLDRKIDQRTKAQLSRRRAK